MFKFLKFRRFRIRAKTPGKDKAATPSKPLPFDFYTPLLVAKEEIERRWNDQNLKSQVELFFGDLLLDQFKNKPRAVFSRSLTTPNFELRQFLKLVDVIKLEPLFLEYPSKFVAKNFEKYHLCRLKFKSKESLKNNNSALKIINFNKTEGRLLNQIKTNNNKNLANFHHQLLNLKYPQLTKEVFDFTGWFDSTRYKTKFYYLYFLALFVCHGVLFDNFLWNDRYEAEFVSSKVLPSFRRIKELFGVTPLIVSLLPSESEKDVEWHWYDEDYYDEFLKEYEKNNINFS